MSPQGRRNVFALGVVSLLTDASSEMILPLLPLFLTTVVGGGALALGVIEGLADGVASVLKLWSGRTADRLGRNRPFVLAGYTLSSLVRPLIALAALPIHVLLVRMTDRIGKGLRSSPRDALLTASVPKEKRGWAYGVHRMMDDLGAAIGPLLAVIALTWISTDLRVVFALSAVPALAAVAVVWLGVTEAHPEPAAPTASDAPPKAPIAPAGPLWPILGPVTLFALGNGSDTFLLLRAGQQDLDPRALPLLWMALHLVKSAGSIPGGALADRIGARPTLLMGWGLYAVCYAALAFVQASAAVVAIVLVYGLHNGLSEPAQKVLVASVAGDKRGTAFGWYHASVGVAGVVASVGFGAIWSVWGPTLAFSIGAGLAGAAALWIAVSPFDQTTAGATPG